jgi:putative nucleotidyltransferase with HDIG domain
MRPPPSRDTTLTDAAEFLTGLGQLLSAASLYPEEHPARAQALEACWSDLQRLLVYGEPSFSFLDDVILYGRHELRDLRSWDLGSRLYEAGIQRVEIGGGVERRELDRLVEHVRLRLAGSDPEGTDVSHRAFPHIRLGSVTVRIEPTAVDEDLESATGEPATLDEELDAVGWAYSEVGSNHRLPAAEVRLAVESLSLSMESLRRSGSALIAIKSRDQYTAIHCMNVSILSMTLAEQLGFRSDEIRAIGEAALLHDIGKTKTPDEILNKPGLLTAEERRVIEDHTVEGCRLLLESQSNGRLAATVTYEHHMGSQGRGYPSKLYDREPHPVSRLVQVCDVYDALRTRRPFRPPMSARESLQFLEKRAGTYFHPALVTVFVQMVQEMEFRTPRVRPQTTTAEMAEREAADSARLLADREGLATRLDAMADSLLAPEPAATIDWLEIL